MEAFVVIALVGFALLLAELLLPTGGLLALIGAAGLVAGGIVALDSNNSDADVIGPALITLGVLSGISFYFVTRKVIAAHRDQPVRTGAEELDRRQRRGPLDDRPRGPGLGPGHGLGSAAGRGVQPGAAGG